MGGEKKKRNDCINGQLFSDIKERTKYEAESRREEACARWGGGRRDGRDKEEKKIRNGGERDTSYICDLKQPRAAA